MRKFLPDANQIDSSNGRPLYGCPEFAAACLVAVAVYIVLGIPNIDASQLSIGEAFGSGIKISSIGAAVSVFASCLSGGTAVSQIAAYSQRRLQRKIRMVFPQEF